MKITFLKFLSITSLIFISACSNAPYSLFDGDHSLLNDIKNYDVYIDDRLGHGEKRRMTLEPGPNRFILNSTKPRLSNGRHEYKTVGIDVQPCTRYILSAQHENTLVLANDDWFIRVLEEREITNCGPESDLKMGL